MNEMYERGSTLFRCENLTKSYSKDRQDVTVLKGVNVELKVGERVAITGASGVGKSTLLHVLGTLEPPTSGKIWFGNPQRDLWAMSENDLAHFRNRNLGFVFQFHYLLPEFTALENVMMPALIAGYERSASEEQARQLLTYVGLKHRLEHRPTEMSGGEQQRVALARAVILRPKLILADEPTGNLDSANGQIVMSLLKQLNEETGVTILLVTHDLSLTKDMHRVLMMRDGIFVESN